MATSTDDFFRSRLDQMIDLRHPLAVLASLMPWQEIESSLAHRFARAAKAGKQIEDIDLFGATVSLSGGGISKAGRPRLPLRLMVSLLYLKHAFNERDEALVERWGETPTWQYFSDLAYFEHRWPCDPTLLVKFRKLIGEEGVEELLARTIEVAVSLKLIAKKELSEIIVDPTVQEKAITHPTDSKLLQAARAKTVECISKGKSRNPYEFGVKVGIATTLKGNLIVGARTFPGNPYDGHTLHEQVEQASILMQATGVRPQTVYVDLGYRGVDQANPDIAIKHRGRFKSLTDEERKNLKRRQAIEPIIGHLKADHRMDRCHLKGAQGDSLHAVLCAAGYNIRWLLRMIAKKGVPFLQTLFLRLLQHSNLAAMGRWAAKEVEKFGAEVRGRRRLDVSVSLALG